MNIDQLSGHDFEDLVEKLIRKMGFITEERKRSSDGGVDIKAINEQPILKGVYIIQCKRYEKPIGEPIIRDLFGVISSERANKGILITNAVFSKAAERFAENKQIELIDGYKLAELFEKHLDKQMELDTDSYIVPDKYRLSFDYLESEVKRINRRKQEVVERRIFINPKIYNNDKAFINYCGRKASKLLSLTEVFKNQVLHFNTLWGSFPGTHAGYVNNQELKRHCRELINTLELIEKEWEDALSINPLRNLVRLHNTLVNIYNPYFNTFSELLEKLSMAVNAPEKVLSDSGSTEGSLTVYLTVTGDEAKAFARELKRAKGEWCFIATVIYQDINAPEVVALRQWRDQVLRYKPLGNLLIQIYYSYGSYLAKLIDKSSTLRRIAKLLMDAFVSKTFNNK